MSEAKVENVKDFLDKLTEIQKNKSDNTELFFRGHADQAYEAEPTIFRKNGNGERNLLKNEKHLFNDMITQCPEDFKDCQYTFEYLVKMQHYGLPTRLLDITSNALVALYFACYSNRSDEFSKDGKVFVYAVRKDAIKNYNSDTVSVLANLAQIDDKFKVFTRMQRKSLERLETLEKKYFNDFKDFFEKKMQENQNGLKHKINKKVKYFLKTKTEEWINLFVNQRLIKAQSMVTQILPYYMKVNTSQQDILPLQKSKISQERFLHFIKQEKGYFVDNIDTEDHVRKVICVRAKLNNQRIVRQNGLFFLFGMGEAKADPIKFSDYIKFEYTKSIQEDREPTIKEITNPTIIISAEKKDDILKELRTLGISKETLMPEIDTVASTLKDRYN